jgi:hypothetical protein
MASGEPLAKETRRLVQDNDSCKMKRTAGDVFMTAQILLRLLCLALKERPENSRQSLGRPSKNRNERQTDDGDQPLIAWRIGKKSELDAM